MADNASEQMGAWVLQDVVLKDNEKAQQLSKWSEEKWKTENDLQTLVPNSLIQKIKALKDKAKLFEFLIANGFKSHELYIKDITKKLKEHYEEVTKLVHEKLKSGLIKGSVTQKRWGGSVGHFKLLGEDTHKGSLTYITPATITISADSNNYTGKDYTIDTSALTEDEIAVFYGRELCNQTLKELIGDSRYSVCYNKKFKV
jgi:hypothetical protein